MLALIEPAPIERKTQRLEHIDGERSLPRGAELPGERRRRMCRLNFDGLIDEARQLARQRLEYGIDVCRRNTGSKAIDQGIVRSKAACLTQQRGLVAHQMDDLFQMGRKQ